MDNVKQTHNYEQFKICDWNRDIKTNNLKRLDKSVQKNGWLVHPITVNEKMEVIDGQHRLIYAQEHNLPLYYTVVEGLRMEDCVVMNNARSAWTLGDYVNYYAGRQNDNYIILKNMVETYTFLSVSTLASIIKGVGTSGNISRAIKDGVFELTSKEYKLAIEKLEFLSKCSSHLLRVPGRASALFVAVAFAYDCPGVNKARLLKKIENDIGIITPPANLDMALKAVEELYNYRITRENYIYIYTEYKKDALLRMSKRSGGRNRD